MQPRGWKRPSPALVLSMVTLFVALTSSAGALPGRGKIEKGDFANGAVTAKALARGAVTKKAIRKHAVTSKKIANRAVIGRTLAPFSVGARALGDTTTVTSDIPDVDAAHDLAWTTSPVVDATCPENSTLLGGGVSITSSTFHEAFVQTSAPKGNKWEGTISTNTGGASPGRVYAVCLL